MKLYIGSDHAGFSLKEELRAYLSKKYEIIDCGTYGPESVDYPDYAKALCKGINEQEVNYGIAICSTAFEFFLSSSIVPSVVTVS